MLIDQNSTNDEIRRWHTRRSGEVDREQSEGSHPGAEQHHERRLGEIEDLLETATLRVNAVTQSLADATQGARST